jgi:pyruvate-formate lyase-activating enzyme
MSKSKFQMVDALRAAIDWVLDLWPKIHIHLNAFHKMAKHGQWTNRLRKMVDQEHLPTGRWATGQRTDHKWLTSFI